MQLLREPHQLHVNFDFASASGDISDFGTWRRLTGASQLVLLEMAESATNSRLRSRGGLCARHACLVTSVVRTCQLRAWSLGLHRLERSLEFLFV